MRTAVVLFAPLPRNVHAGTFLSLCIDKVRKDCFTVLHPTTWADYRNVNFEALFWRLAPQIDAVYLFVDHGATDLMRDIVKQYYRNGKFEKTIFIETVRYERSGLSNILAEVASKTKLTVDQIRSKSRKRELADARFYFFKLARTYTNLSLEKIGTEVCCDHTTVLNGLKRMEEVHQLKKEFSELFERVDPPPVARHPEKTEEKAMLLGIPSRKAFIQETKFEASYIRPFSGYRQHQM